MRKIPLYVYGAGGLGLEAFYEIKNDSNTMRLYDLCGFIDDAVAKVHSSENVFSLSDVLNTTGGKNVAVFVAIATPEIRQKIVNKLKNYGFLFPSFILGTNYSPSISSEGVLVSFGCIVNPNVILKDFVILDEAVVVGHDTVIGSFSTAYGRAFIAGCVDAGEKVQFGGNSTTLQGLHICDGAFIGGGAVVIKDVTLPGTYAGVPAKLLHHSK